MMARRYGRYVGIAGLFAALLGMTAAAQAVDDPPKPESAEVVAAINAAIEEAWASGEIRPSPKATEPEFLRRAYLDTLGRIPNLQEATSYLENRDPNKRIKLVDLLLAHPDYAKNFGTIWTVNLVGRRRQERNVDRGALTAWLRLQFANNRPWDQMARELIAVKGSNKENGAANFTLAHMEFDKVPLTSVTTRVFLGQQIQCTQCHDHPSTDRKQGDFWSINAFYKGTRSRVVTRVDSTGAEVDDHVELYDEPTDAYAKYDRRDGTVRIAFPAYLDGRKISQGTEVDRREELGRFVTGGDNPDFARAMVNRMWAHYFGRGFVHPVDDMGDHNPPSHSELLDQLADVFRRSGYDVKALCRWIMTSRAYGLTSRMTPDNDKDETLFSHVGLKPMTPEQLHESLLVATAAHQAGGGDNDAKRERWLNQFLFTFATDEGEESTSFQGTIPQALMMMNGDLMEEAVGGKPGSFLRGLVEQSQIQRGSPPDVFVISRLYLAALSRPPSPPELNTARELLRRNPDPIGVVQDVFWALLNSNEFVLNH